MSSLTIEVEDPRDAYENLRAMLDAAPVELSQVTSVRLELEYEPAENPGDDADDATNTDVDGTAVNPAIADAEGGIVDEQSQGTGDDGLSDAAEKISFRPPGEADDPGDDAESIFGDPNETSEQDSVFSAADESADAVSFDGPNEDASGDAATTTDASTVADATKSADSATATDTARTSVDGTTLGDPVERSTSDSPAGASIRGTGEATTASETTATETTATASADQSATETAASEEGSSGGKSPSPRTYNKVMRLLQNRDFPIERTEIEDVAVGAYNVDPDECRAIVDAAIEKGLVAQRGSKLVDPTE